MTRCEEQGAPRPVTGAEDQPHRVLLRDTESHSHLSVRRSPRLRGEDDWRPRFLRALRSNEGTSAARVLAPSPLPGLGRLRGASRRRPENKPLRGMAFFVYCFVPRTRDSTRSWAFSQHRTSEQGLELKSWEGRRRSAARSSRTRYQGEPNSPQTHHRIRDFKNLLFRGACLLKFPSPCGEATPSYPEGRRSCRARSSNTWLPGKAGTADALLHAQGFPAPVSDKRREETGFSASHLPILHVKWQLTSQEHFSAAVTSPGHQH